MSELPFAKGFRELLVYQRARQLAQDLFNLTATFPREEMYSLTDQLRRSSRSVGAQVAEAWGVRRYERSFVAKLVVADGEQFETQHWVETARDCGYINPQAAKEILERCAEISRLLNGMITKSDRFCKNTSSRIKEPLDDYFTEPTNYDNKYS